MADFKIFNTFLNPIEGEGAPKGERSRYGVTEELYYDVFKRKKDYTLITYDEAVKVREYVWNKVKGSQIASQDVANMVADAAINSGFETATHHVQQAINKSFEAKIADDGYFGILTVTALNSAVKQNEAMVFNAIRSRRITFYTTECKNPLCPGLVQSRLDRYLPAKAIDPTATVPTANTSIPSIVSNSAKALLNPQADKMTAAFIVGAALLLVGGVAYLIWNNMQKQKVFAFR